MKKITKFVLRFALILSLMAAIESVLGDGNLKKAGKTDNGKSDEKSKAIKGKKNANTYRIGDSVEVGNMVYKVWNAETAEKLTSRNDMIRPVATEGKFLVIDMEIYNNGKKNMTIDNRLFKVRDGMGREYESSVDMDVLLLLKEHGDLYFKDINPGISKRGKLVFELPKDAENYTLAVSGGSGWSEGKYEVIALH